MEQQHLLTTVTPNVIAPPATTTWRDALPTLIGDRISLRELGPSDAATLAPMLAAPEVARFISAPPSNAEQFGWFIDWSRRERQAGRYAAFAVVPRGSDRAVGLLQVRQLDPAFHTAEWGFVLGAPFWGAGLFLDAARLFLDFAFGTIGVRRLEARAAVPNARGNAVMRKLGAVEEGVLRRALVTATGEQFDQVLWSLLSDEWHSTTARLRARVH